MTPSEKSLLLTVARILRARIKEVRFSKNDDDDIWSLNEALVPFDPVGEDAPSEKRS
jgi:hypothetical protein